MPDRAPPALPPLRDVIARHGIEARRSLGQHFLLDPALLARVARAAGDLTHGTTIEIGPGPGGLTRALLAAGAAHVIAIERDHRCIAALADLAAAYPSRLTLVEADALAVDIVALADRDSSPAPLRVVANLPYNIATPLLIGWLRQASAIESLTLMFQKEVAQRLSARPSTKAYGRLSVITQWLCDVTSVFDIAPGAFLPPPAVTSTVVRLDPRPTPLAAADPRVLKVVLAAAFGQRRKMLRRSLASLAGGADALARSGIDPTLRAEALDVAAFCALARALSAVRENDKTGRKTAPD